MTRTGVRFVDECEPGVVRVMWQPDPGRADLFLLVHAAHADPRWHQLADVLVLHSGPVVFDELPGCVLMAVGPPECALYCRDGARIAVAGELVEWAIAAYMAVVSGCGLGDAVRHLRWSRP